MLISLEKAINELDAWVTNHGWAGYDPYDIRGQDWFVNLFGKQTWLHRKFRGLLFLIEHNMPPMSLRKILNVKKEINAKGMGLLATAYLCLSSTSGRRDYVLRAEQILDWLKQNSSHGYPGISWGYPFHWQSRIMIPRGTPSVVVTGIVGDAWLDHFKITGSGSSLGIAHLIAEFLLNGLNRHEKCGNQLCFSYTPMDHFKVHNANLFGAAFLSRLGIVTNHDLYIDVAMKAVRYTLSEQNEDGSFNYWSAEPSSIIDHYHTGFILRHLHTIYKMTNESVILKSLHQGYSFYLKNFFTPSGIPKFTPTSLYPINIHSCSEAILTLSQLGNDYGGFDKVEAVLDFTISKMRSKKGYYIAEIRNRFGIKQKIEVPYMRWAQCWMFLALARLYQKISSTAKTGEQSR